MIHNPFEQIVDKLDTVTLQLTQLQLQLNEQKSRRPNPSERLTRKQVNEQYKISYGTIHNLMKSGKLSYEKCGRKTLFLRSDLEQIFKINS